MQFGDRNPMDYPAPFDVSLHQVMVVCDGFIRRQASNKTLKGRKASKNPRSASPSDNKAFGVDPARHMDVLNCREL